MKKILSVDAKGLKDMQSGRQVQIIDVREPTEYNSGHIENSTNIPLSCLLNEIDQFDFSKEMIMVCRAGVRSRLACEQLIAEGYNFDLFNLEGGVIAWENAGYKTKK